MLSCWRVKPETRPLFNALADSFSQILGTEVTDRYDNLNAPYLVANRSRFSLDCVDYVSLLDSTDNDVQSSAFSATDFEF